MLLILITVIIQHIYLFLYFNDTTKYKKEVFQYLSSDYSYKQEMTIYKCGNLSSKKVICCISGSFILTAAPYVQKMVFDLLSIQHLYCFLIIEKMDKSSIVMYDDIANYLLHFHSRQHMEELIMFGFSSGGVIASHVLSKLKNLKIKKKLLTYDTPYQVMDNVLSFEKNIVYRVDFYFYHTVFQTYKNHYNYHKIKEDVVRYKYLNGATDFINMIKRIHSFSDEEMRFVTGFNYSQDSDTPIINIYCKHDPFINEPINKNMIANTPHNFHIKNIYKNKIGHCSDLWTPFYNTDLIIQQIIS